MPMGPLPRSARKEFERAVSLFNQGHLAAAEDICRELESRHPRDAELAHFGGVLANRMGDYEAAVRRLTRCAGLQPGRAKVHAALGFALEQLGRLDEARQSFAAAVRAEPGFAQAHNGLGVVFVKLGDAAGALPHFERAMALDAASVEPRLNAARALLDMGRDTEAASRFREAAGLARADDALRASAMGLYQAGDFDSAVGLYAKLVARNAADASLRGEYALALESAGRSGEALAMAQAAAASGEDAAAHDAYGLLLLNRGRYDEAVAELGRALALDPQMHEAAFNLAAAQRAAGRAGDARATLDALEPRLDAVGLASLAVRYADLGDSARCIAIAERAIARDATIAAAHSTLAIELLRTGELERGWREYTYRPWRGSEILAQVAAGSYPPPMPGELAGRDVVILSEQGLGDMLFFLRFAKPLADAGARLHAMRLDPRLLPMVRRSMAIEAWPGDRAIEPGTLALWAGDLPAFVQARGVRGDEAALALAPLPDRVAKMAERLGTAKLRRVGIAWQAGVRAQRRSVRQQFLWKEVTPRALGESLAGLPLQLVSIQRHPEPGALDELERACGAKVLDLSEANGDLEDMLALLALLDEYAGVSSTNIHLRAGLGRGGHVLVPFPPDWRWQAAGASAWFPAFATYRQSPSLDWAGALGALRAGLA